MSTAERRQEEIKILKKKIITAASKIMTEEGYEGLSIRKIASRIEYSPGIIYHYFKDKSEIVSTILEEEYNTILKTIESVPVDIENPENSLIKGLTAYINLMLGIPNEFRAIMMNDIGGLQDKVNVLQKGISADRKSIGKMCDLIKLGIKLGRFRELDAELTAQIIWSSTFGLISRLILEKDISEDQRTRLINHHFQILINGLKK